MMNTDAARMLSQSVECPAFCFDVIAIVLKNNCNDQQRENAHAQPFIPRVAAPSSWSAIACPVFVTWNSNAHSVRGTAEWRLRGCIGTFIQRPLEENLRTYAQTRYSRSREMIIEFENRARAQPA